MAMLNYQRVYIYIYIYTVFHYKGCQGSNMTRLRESLCSEFPKVIFERGEQFGDFNMRPSHKINVGICKGFLYSQGIAICR